MVDHSCLNARDRSRSEQYFQLCEMAVISSEHDRWLVPTNSVYERNTVVVLRLVVERDGNVRALLAVAPHNNGRRNKLNSAESGCDILSDVLVEHPPLLAVGA